MYSDVGEKTAGFLKLYVSSVELVKHRRTQIVFQDIFWAMVTAL